MPAETFAFVLFPLALICTVHLAYRLWKRELTVGLLFLLLPIGCEGIAVKSALCIRRDWEGVEEGASFASKDLVGTWRFEKTTMTFGSDGICVDGNGASSRWSTDVGRGTVRCADTAFAVWRKFGQLVLLPYERVALEKDPDEWNLHVMYFRDPPSSAEVAAGRDGGLAPLR